MHNSESRYLVLISIVGSDCAACWMTESLWLNSKQVQEIFSSSMHRDWPGARSIVYFIL